jgi:hypothetical protein
MPPDRQLQARQGPLFHRPRPGPRLAQDERLLTHRAQGHPRLAGQPVARRGDHHQFVVVEDLGI